MGYHRRRLLWSFACIVMTYCSAYNTTNNLHQHSVQPVVFVLIVKVPRDARRCSLQCRILGMTFTEHYSWLYQDQVV